jgi:hypothetical protein
MKRIWLIVFLLAVALAAQLPAEETKKESAKEGMPMPEMGTPKEMAVLKPLVGEWKSAVKSKMDPSSEQWNESSGSVVCTEGLGGAVLQSVHKGNMMGMPFEGVGIYNYNRETKKYQSYWIDNLAAYPSLYDGEFDTKTGNLVFTGVDLWQGSKVYARMTLTMPKDNKFMMIFEQSMDGKNYGRVMEITYSR